MKKFVRRTNDYFIASVLALFYIFVIGVSFLVLKIRNLVSKKEDGGWTSLRSTKNDFSSPY